MEEGRGLTDESEYGNSVIHVTAGDWQFRWEEEEDSSQKGECQPSLIVSTANGHGEARTILQIGPRMGPRVKVGSGREGGRRIFRPLMTTSRTGYQRRSTTRQGGLTWN